MRTLIVNADDFGISEGVNRGIVEAHQRGILTSTTIMANMPAVEHAARLAMENPRLGVGVHLTLTAGEPVLPPSSVPSLVGDDGHFRRGDRTLLGLTLGRVKTAEVEAELSAQVEKALEAGITPTHLDSHHHLHAHPSLQPIVVRLALRYGIAGLRTAVELRGVETVARVGMLLQGNRPGDRESPRNRYLKGVILSLLGYQLRWRARRAGLKTPDQVRGLLLGMAFGTADLQGLLRSLPEGVTELMCHPGYVDETLEKETSYSHGRDSELRALVDPANRDILDQAGVRLASYSDLSI